MKTCIYQENSISEIERLKLLINGFQELYYKEEYLPSFPFIVGLKITGKCNLSCTHCWADLNKEDYDTNILLKIIHELKVLGVYHINISGGEPFLRQDLFKIISYIKAGRKLSMGIYTNGTLLDYAKILRLLQFWNFDTDFLHISFDGLSRQSLTSIRGLNYLAHLKRNISLLVKNHIKVRLHCTVNYYNVLELFNIFSYANKLGVTTLSITPMSIIGKANTIKERFDSLSYFKEILKIRHYQQSHNSINVRIFMPSEIFLKGALSIIGPYESSPSFNHFHDLIIHNYEVFHTALINSNLDVNLIPYLTRDNYLGNLQFSSFRDIWNNSLVLRKKFFERNLTNTPCDGCEYYPFCKGGDWVISYNLNEYIDCASPICFKKNNGDIILNEVSYK